MPFGVPDYHAFHIEQGLTYFFRNDFHTALVEFDQAIAIRDSDMARFDRAHALLALGRYSEAWPDYAARYGLFGDAIALTDAGRAIRRRLPHWTGQPDGRLAVLAEGGFGDTIMMLRFLTPLMCRFEALDVVLDVPEPLRRLAGQCAPLGDRADMWCSLFDLPAIFDPVIPLARYLRPDPVLVTQWHGKVFARSRDARRIGIAWSSDTNHVGEHEHQTRSLPLESFLAQLPVEGALFSLQHHDRDEAARLGVHTPELADFADVAALASLMDVIVSIDTAALHVAGAIGHRHTYALLPWAPTWRWHAGNRWYPQVKLCQADAPGEWSSAFAKIEDKP